MPKFVQLFTIFMFDSFLQITINGLYTKIYLNDIATDTLKFCLKDIVIIY